MSSAGLQCEGSNAFASFRVIQVAHNEPKEPPHVLQDGHAVCKVPADGLCFYYCAVACKNLRAWNESRAENGLANTIEMQGRERAEAQQVRNSIIDLALKAQDKSVADRLRVELSV